MSVRILFTTNADCCITGVTVTNDRTMKMREWGGGRVETNSTYNVISVASTENTELRKI